MIKDSFQRYLDSHATLHLHPAVVLYHNREQGVRLVANPFNLSSPIESFSEELFEFFELLASGVPVEEFTAQEWLVEFERNSPGAILVRGNADFSKMEQHFSTALKLVTEKESVRSSQTHEECVKYHSQSLADAFKQFEVVETTVSHIFREPHVALSNRNYGEALADLLLTDKVLSKDLGGKHAAILEIGCGVGLVARSILSRIRSKDSALFNKVKYTLFELSPELQRSQREQCADFSLQTEFIRGDVLSWDEPEGCYDFILSNEMIADLPVSPVGEQLEVVQRYGLEYLLSNPGRLLNIGAIRLLEKVARALKPKGCALITEYGGVGQDPLIAKFEGHAEFSIDFEVLVKVAKQLNLRVELQTVGELLEFDPQCRIVHGASIDTLSYLLLPYLKHEPLPRIAYTKESLSNKLMSTCGEGLDCFFNIQDVALKEQWGLTPYKFYALSLTLT